MIVTAKVGVSQGNNDALVANADDKRTIAGSGKLDLFYESLIIIFYVKKMLLNRTICFFCERNESILIVSVLDVAPISLVDKLPPASDPARSSM